MKLSGMIVVMTISLVEFRESFKKGKGIDSIKDRFPEEIINKLF